MFSNCKNLKSIIIPGTIISYDTLVFENYYKLTNVIFENGIPEIGSKSFLYCTGLKTITLVSSITKLGRCAFEECSSLQTINIQFGSELKYIDEHAFYKCVSLSTVSLCCCVNLSIIGRSAFGFCYKLEQFSLFRVEQVHNYAFEGAPLNTFSYCSSSTFSGSYDSIFYNCPNTITFYVTSDYLQISPTIFSKNATCIYDYYKHCLCMVTNPFTFRKSPYTQRYSLFLLFCHFYILIYN